jgi:NAD(P)-dependent dehydrogenase (short-subunit alcohol dehydrogenase family)
LAASLDDAQSCQRLAADAREVIGGVDILINNAAIGAFGPTSAIDESDFDACFAVNVKAPFFMVAALAPGMAERGHGVIVNVSTMVASFGSAGSAVYAASKDALNSLTKSWAAEYGPRGVRVNAVAPGPTATENARAQFGEGGLAAMMRHTPARRVATPDEIAETIAYLASDRASFIHGAVVPIDGGRTAV